MPRPALKSMMKPGEKVIRPIRANVGLRVLYRDRLLKLLDDMHDDVRDQVMRQYKTNPPATMAMDISPIGQMRRLIAKLSRDWTKRINETAPKLAEWFAMSVQKRSDNTLKRILRDGGMTVRFKPTPGVVDAMTASVTENVSLIKSIGSQYFGRIEQAVMRSAMAGGDVGALARDLQRIKGVDARRAALIARDQNSKMTAIVVRERQREIGIKYAIWMHSHGGHQPRPSHLANDGKRYNVETGWFDPDEQQWIHPGWLINCRCTSRSLIPGFEDDEE